MERLKSDKYFDRDTILHDTLQILRGLTSDWEMGFAGALGPATRLSADLALESVQLVQLVIAIEEHFKCQELPFQQLFVPAERQIDDLQVSELVDFLSLHLNKPLPGP